MTLERVLEAGNVSRCAMPTLVQSTYLDDTRVIRIGIDRTSDTVTPVTQDDDTAMYRDRETCEGNDMMQSVTDS